MTNFKHAPFIALTSIALLIALATGETVSAQSEEESVELYDYVVQKGDSCAGIAERELGSRKGYRSIHKYNALGALPHRLKPGTTLRLPRKTLLPDAKLEARMGKVEFRKAAESIWDSADQGMDIFRAWRVWSHAKSTAVLVFRDDSVLSLRNDTVVVIHGPTSTEGRRRLVRAELETGALRSRLANLEGRLLVETESSSVELEAGSTVIAASAQSKRSTVSNHEGGAVAVRPRTKPGKKRGKSVAVAAGKGTWIDPGKAPAPPRDLPKAPVLRTTAPVQIAMSGSDATLIGSWNPVSEAMRYRVEVATDPTVRIVVAAFEVTEDITSFEARGLKPGTYYVSVASIDDKGLESAPSKRLVVQTALLEHRQPEGSDSQSPVQGAQLLAPESMRCSADDGPLGSSIALLKPGRVEIQCTDANGAKSNVFTVDVAGSNLAFHQDTDSAALLEQGQAREFTVKSNPPLPKTARLRVEAADHVQASIVSVGTSGIQIHVETNTNSPLRSSLRIFRTTAAGEYLLATLPLALAPVQPPPIPVASRQVSIAPVIGAFALGLEDNRDNSHYAPFAGARLRLQLTGPLDLEAEASLARDSADHSHWFAANQLLLAMRTSLSADWRLRGRLGPALWLNNDPQTERTSTLGAAFGLGLERTLGPGAIRLDASAFALGDATGRLGISISYDFRVDRSR